MFTPIALVALLFTGFSQAQTCTETSSFTVTSGISGASGCYEYSGISGRCLNEANDCDFPSYTSSNGWTLSVGGGIDRNFSPPLYYYFYSILGEDDDEESWFCQSNSRTPEDFETIVDINEDGWDTSCGLKPISTNEFVVSCGCESPSMESTPSPTPGATLAATPEPTFPIHSTPEPTDYSEETFGETFGEYDDGEMFEETFEEYSDGSLGSTMSPTSSPTSSPTFSPMSSPTPSPFTGGGSERGIISGSSVLSVSGSLFSVLFFASLVKTFLVDMC